MGLFEFFRKKNEHAKQEDRTTEQPQVDKNQYVLSALKAKLADMGYEVKRHPQYVALIINDELELGIMVIENPNYHPSLMHLMVSASHAKHFPDGIIESIVGAGSSFDDRVDSALNNYISSTFLTIMDGFTDSHDPELDFKTTSRGGEILWHPKIGTLHIQGQWNEVPPDDYFFRLLLDEIPGKLTTNKIDWLKIYISKRADGTIIGECNFNNENWAAGQNIIYAYAETWVLPGEFQGLKQFIVFRRCDAYDEVV